jgi:RimJ/RimL family protein N-acetyltransferase
VIDVGISAKRSPLDTERLILRQWRDEDYATFAGINADPRVMRYFPQTLSRSESDELADRCRELIAARGWGFWAVELKRSGEFIGLVGLNSADDRIPCSPSTEIGWRLGFGHWGKGYATEAANRALRYAFEALMLDEVVAFTTVTNRRSRAVMKRLGMVDTRCNFMHPAVTPNHPLSEHELYSISRSVWNLR